MLTGAANMYIAKEFGGDFVELDGEVSVGTSPTKIVDNDPDAVALVIINLGANTVYLRPANNPSSTAGIQINASGGNMSVNVRDDLTLPSRQWYGVADTAASDVYFVRVRRFGLPSGGGA